MDDWHVGLIRETLLDGLETSRRQALAGAQVAEEAQQVDGSGGMPDER